MTNAIADHLATAWNERHAERAPPRLTTGACFRGGRRFFYLDLL
jgi:hypothetical protein